MGHTLNPENFFSSENENIEIFACFPWSGIKKKSDMIHVEGNKADSLSSPNKDLLLGLCFITDMEGYFKYIHPNFLKLFEGVENHFFESSFLDGDSTSSGPASVLKYLVAMIQKTTRDSFFKNRFSKCTKKLNWDMVYSNGLLYFSLAEAPISNNTQDATINPDESPEQVLTREIRKVYWKIEQAKMFHGRQLSTKKSSQNQSLRRSLVKKFFL